MPRGRRERGACLHDSGFEPAYEQGVNGSPVLNCACQLLQLRELQKIGAVAAWQPVVGALPAGMQHLQSICVLCRSIFGIVF